MQIVQTLNDFIKILYAPSIESICLGDFILVQEATQRFLGQVVEITDDRFDDSKNIAQIKLMYSINEKGEIVDFNNHLPSKQCDILYANRREIVDFINEGKSVIKLGEDFKFSKPFEINVDFFRNNPLIFCDKIKEHNYISSRLAKKLSQVKNSIVFDYTGSLEIEGSQRFCAAIDFKLPLDFYSLDYIWEKGLSDASLETQAICGEIFNEVKNYSLLTKDKFIPFKQFVKVVSSQYKATPIKELLVLKNRLQKYQQEEIFANSKAEFTGIFKNLSKEKVTIIDLSKLKPFWHKDFTEFILRNIGINSFVFLRLNESNFDLNLLQLLYGKNKKITPVPSVSHGFAKLPLISEHCPNYIIMPSASSKKDFGYINNTIASMPEDSILLYGKDSKNFAFLIKNLDSHKKEEHAKKATPKVTFEGDVIKNMRVKDKLTQLNQKKIREIEQDVDKFISGSIKLPPQKPVEVEPEVEVQEFVPPIQEPFVEKETNPLPQPEHFQIEEIISEEELDLIDSLDLNVDEEPVEDSTVSLGEASYSQLVSPEATITEEEIPLEALQEEIHHEEEIVEENFEQVEMAQVAFMDETSEQNKNEIFDSRASEAKDTSIIEEIKEEKSEETAREEIVEEEALETIEEFSLEDLAAESIETAFEQIVEEEPDEATQPQAFVPEPEPVEAEEEVMQGFSKEFIEEIPIFTPADATPKSDEKYHEGDSVVHEKYGNGKVLQVVEYSDKVLLQIEFKQIGKRLLDPIAAGLRKI